MDKKVKIEILPDGRIKAETLGIKGKDCLPFIKILEQLLNAEVVDSKYTHEYYETKVNTTQTIFEKNTLKKE